MLEEKPQGTPILSDAIHRQFQSVTHFSLLTCVGDPEYRGISDSAVTGTELCREIQKSL